MTPEPLTKEKIRTHLEQDEEGRWVIHVAGVRVYDIKSAVQLVLKEIEKEQERIKTLKGYNAGKFDGLEIAKIIIKKAFSGVVEK